MVGNQLGFKYITDTDLVDLGNIVVDRIQQALEKYSLDSDQVVYIQLLFRKVNTSIITEFSIDETTLGIKSIPRLDSHSIPISVDKYSLGIPLTTYSNSENNIYRIDYKVKGVTYNLMDYILDKNKHLKSNHVDKLLVFSSDYTFHLISTTTTSYILGVLKIYELEYKKVRFSLSGVVLNSITDTLTKDNVILRRDGNTVFYIKNNTIFYSKQELNLIPLIKPSLYTKTIENPNIGVIDCETYQDNIGNYKVYSIGFKTNLAKEPVIYYVDSVDNINSTEIVLRLVDELLRNKYENTNFYCHNLGGFDVVFILKILMKYNEIHTDNPYKISTICRDNKILKITISRKINDKLKSFAIKDSYALLNNSLDKLAKSFNLSMHKGLFPYKLSKENNLFYTGLTPDIKYYSDIDIKDYNTLITQN